MNSASIFPSPTLATQHPGVYYADEWSSPSSFFDYDRRRGGSRDDRRAPLSSMPTTSIGSPRIVQQQHKLWRHRPSLITPVEQLADYRSRSGTQLHRSSERHRDHYDSRDRSREESRLPQGHEPSPDRHSSDVSRFRGFSTPSPTQNIPTGNRLLADPRTQASTFAGNSTIPAQYTTLSKPSYDSSRHRSDSNSGSHPHGYFSSRPLYFHSPSWCHDDMLSRSQRNVHPQLQQSSGRYSPVPTRQIGTSTYLAPRYPAIDVDHGVGRFQTSYASPRIMRPPAHATTVLPLNNGKDGWVVVPAQGQRLSVVSGRHPGASGNKHRDRHSPSTGSFFSRVLNFGKSSKKDKLVVPQQPPTLAQPVQYIYLSASESSREKDTQR